MRALKNTSKHDLARPEWAGRQAPLGPGAAFSRLFATQNLRLPILPTACLAIGAAAYFTAPVEPDWLMVILPALPALAITVWSRTTHRQIFFWSSLCVMAVTLGATTAKIRTLTAAAPVLFQEIGPARIEGRLVEIDSNDRNKRMRLEVHAIEGLSRSHTPRYVRFSYPYEIQFAPGRDLACAAILSPPPAPTIHGDYVFNRDAWFDQLGAVGFAIGRCEPIFVRTPSGIWARFEYRLAAIRRAITQHVVRVGGENGGALAAAMVAGDRSNIDPADVEALRGSGLAHLLAISGLHMALAGGAFFIGLRLVWPLTGTLALNIPAIKVAAAGAIIGCSVYFLLSGGSIATQRAFIMALIAFGAKIVDKPALSLRSLAIAFAVIVVWRPEAVVTPGFQMSFAASAALIGTFEAWPGRNAKPGAAPRNKILAWIAGATTTSVTASLATMPFAIHHFDRAATLSIPANLAATPIISFWAAPSAAGALIASAVGLQDPFLVSLSASLEQVVAIAHWANEHSPDIQLPPITGGVLLLFVLGIGTFAIFTSYSRLICIPPLVAAMFAWTTSSRSDGYIGSDGTLYFNTQAGWGSLQDWQKYEALKPLLFDGRLTNLSCPPSGQTCRNEIMLGNLEYETRLPPEADPGERKTESNANLPCVSMGTGLRLMPGGGGPSLTINPCDLPGGYSAEIRLTKDGPKLNRKLVQANRPWTPEARLQAQ